MKPSLILTRFSPFSLLPVLLGLLFALTSWSTQGATLYKWVDEQGNVTYQDTPPKENVEFEESIVDAPPPKRPSSVELQTEEAARDNPVSLYTVPACDSCDLIRIFLERNAIPFAEKNVQNNVDMQAELTQVAGALTVPTLTIGDTVLDGYSRSAISAALTSAGFPIGQAALPQDDSQGEFEPEVELEAGDVLENEETNESQAEEDLFPELEIEEANNDND